MWVPRALTAPSWWASPLCVTASGLCKRKSGNTRQRLSARPSPGTSRPRRIITIVWPSRSTRKCGATPCPGLIQKQKIKRQYAKQAREAAKQGAKAAEKTAVTTEKLAARAVGFVKRHPVGALLFVAVFLLLVMMQSCMSSLATLGNGTAGAIGASTYPAEDADLLGAEAAYCALEAELQNYLDTYESTHDYDEYHYDLDEIEHDPYVLLSIISAWHEGEWTLDEVQDTLQMLFDRQYILTEDVVVEVRYRTETRTDSEGNDYDVEVPYNYYICTVTLSNENLSHLPVYIMGEEQLSRYALYMATLGNRPISVPQFRLCRQVHGRSRGA